MARAEARPGDDYNYAVFPQDMDRPTFEAFADHLHAGEQAPDGEVIDAATGERARLSQYWRAGMLVIEFGSFT